MSSCNLFHRRHQAGVVAEIGSQVLTEEDMDRITAGMMAEDSAFLARHYIRQWATDILLYEKASSSRSEEIETLVDDYRRSLYVHEYEQHLVSRNMPKEVDDTLIGQFYEEHIDRFILKESVMKGILLVFPKGAPKTDKLRKWLQKPDEENLEYVEKYMYQYGTGYELFLTECKTESQVLLRLPMEADVLRQQLHRKQLIEAEDSVSLYWLQVTDKRFAGDYIPIEFAKTEISQIILARRQTEFLKEEREKMFDEAVKYRKIILYNED